MRTVTYCHACVRRLFCQLNRYMSSSIRQRSSLPKPPERFIAKAQGGGEHRVAVRAILADVIVHPPEAGAPMRVEIVGTLSRCEMLDRLRHPAFADELVGCVTALNFARNCKHRRSRPSEVATVRGRRRTYVFDLNGEPRWIRTIDPLIKSQMLYRLSYGLTLGQEAPCGKRPRALEDHRCMGARGQ